jgi:hypothetical protein
VNELVLGIDPGPEQTAFVWFDGDRPGLNGIVSNEEMLALLAQAQTNRANIFCEDIASYGMAVGASVFSTCIWIGRYWQRCVDHARFNRVYRRDVKLHLCHSPRAKDGNVRVAFIDRIGPQGTKRQPGPTYGIRSHVWAALAVAVYGHDQLSGRTTIGRPPA